MKKRNTGIGILLICILCLSLSACGGGTSLPQAQSVAGERAANSVTKKESKLMFTVTRDQYGTEKEFISREYERDVLRTQIISKSNNTYIRKEYDEQGRQAKDYNINGEVVGEYRYDEKGRIIYFLTVNTHSWLMYDDQGNEIYHVGVGGGIVAEFTYDGTGRPVAILYSHESAGIQILLTFAYSSDGRQLEVTQAYNGETKDLTSVEYDGLGHIIREVDRSLKYETEKVWVYNESGRLVEQSSYQDGALSSRTMREFDAEGRLITTETQMLYSNGTYSEVTSYVRDADGKLVERRTKTVAADGTQSEKVETTEYDPLGNPTAEYVFEDSVLIGETKYNSHGDCSAVYQYSSYDGSVREATYYIYDYDDIDPRTVGLSMGEIP